MWKEHVAEGEKEKDLHVHVLLQDFWRCWLRALQMPKARAQNCNQQLKKARINSHYQSMSDRSSCSQICNGGGQKEKVAFDKATCEIKTNLAAFNKAVRAIGKGMGEFLQTNVKGLVSKLDMLTNKA